MLCKAVGCRKALIKKKKRKRKLIYPSFAVIILVCFSIYTNLINFRGGGNVTRRASIRGKGHFSAGCPCSPQPSPSCTAQRLHAGREEGKKGSSCSPEKSRHSSGKGFHICQAPQLNKQPIHLARCCCCLAIFALSCCVPPLLLTPASNKGDSSLLQSRGRLPAK